MHIEGWTQRETAEVQAMIEVMYFVAKADGVFSIPERRQFFELVDSLSEGRIESSQLLAVVDGAEAKLESDGLDACLTALTPILRDELSRRIAYGLATKVAMADGDVEPREQLVLDAVARVFAFAPDEPEEIVESVRMSSRPPLTGA